MCQLYVHLCSTEFCNDQARTHWVLSYLKEDHAATFADQVLCFEVQCYEARYETWGEFLQSLSRPFTQRMKPLRPSWSWCFQGRHVIDTYMDDFEDLINRDLHGDSQASFSSYYHLHNFGHFWKTQNQIITVSHPCSIWHISMLIWCISGSSKQSNSHSYIWFPSFP